MIYATSVIVLAAALQGASARPAHLLNPGPGLESVSNPSASNPGPVSAAPTEQSTQSVDDGQYRPNSSFDNGQYTWKPTTTAGGAQATGKGKSKTRTKNKTKTKHHGHTECGGPSASLDSSEPQPTPVSGPIDQPPIPDPTSTADTGSPTTVGGMMPVSSGDVESDVASATGSAAGAGVSAVPFSPGDGTAQPGEEGDGDDDDSGTDDNMNATNSLSTAKRRLNRRATFVPIFSSGGLVPVSTTKTRGDAQASSTSKGGHGHWHHGHGHECGATHKSASAHGSRPSTRPGPGSVIPIVGTEPGSPGPTPSITQAVKSEPTDGVDGGAGTGLDDTSTGMASATGSTENPEESDTVAPGGGEGGEGGEDTTSGGSEPLKRRWFWEREDEFDL
ncbi:hypothetical protein C8R47DRAFT_1138085, partial [Mycena vitilis]